MLSIKSIGKLGAVIAAAAVASQNTGLSAEVLPSVPDAEPVIRRLANTTISKEIGPGILLRADIVPQDSSKEVIILAGAKIYPSHAKTLLSKTGVDSIYSGTFFAHNISMGDIVGFSIKDPQAVYSKSFGWGNKSKTGKSVHNRFYFGTRHTGEVLIGRRSELKDDTGKLIPAGASLEKHFQSFLGGLARIDIQNKTTRQALLDGNKKEFIRQFNLDNRNYNKRAAYDGLDGARTRARSGIVVCEHPQSGQQVVMPLSIGNGLSELKGVTIFGFARQAMFIAESNDLIITSIALADGGGSVSYYSKTGKSSVSTRPPSTAFAVVQRKQLIAQNNN